MFLFYVDVVYDDVVLQVAPRSEPRIMFVIPKVSLLYCAADVMVAVLLELAIAIPVKIAGVVVPMQHK